MQEPTGYEEREQAALAELGRRRVWFRAMVQLAAILLGVAAGVVLYYTVALDLYPEPNPYAQHDPADWVGAFFLAIPVILFSIAGAFIARRLVRLRTPTWRAEVAAAWQLREEQLAETIRLLEKARL